MDDSLSFYLLGCRACGNGGLVLVMPFGSAEERGKWATKHTQGTGHGWGYGLSDAVAGWSDCNRASGHIYRVDDTDPKYRKPGETVTVYVPRAQVEWFKKHWDGDQT